MFVVSVASLHGTDLSTEHDSTSSAGPKFWKPMPLWTIAATTTSGVLLHTHLTSDTAVETLRTQGFESFFQQGFESFFQPSMVQTLVVHHVTLILGRCKRDSMEVSPPITAKVPIIASSAFSSSIVSLAHSKVAPHRIKEGPTRSQHRYRSR
jgi:hypothetical protein